MIFFLLESKIPTLNQKNVAFQVVKKLPVERSGQISRAITNMIGIKKNISVSALCLYFFKL